MILKKIALSLAPMVILAACNDSTSVEDPMPTTFEVSIENVSVVYDLASSGVFNTPVGSTAPGPLMPGSAYEATFSAAPGSKLFFATMFVQSNDLFYAPTGNGIALYDSQNQPLTGDVTSQVMLWDSGTEIDQEPGLGADQAPRQSGPDTGASDPTTTVRMATDDFGNLPNVSNVILVSLTYLGEGRFTLTIENIAAGTALATSTGSNPPVLLAPGVWAVGNGTDVLFSSGTTDSNQGLEELAEDGNPAVLATSLGMRSGLTSPLAPGAWAVHTGSGVLFVNGQADLGNGLEAVAEDGDPSTLIASLGANADVSSSGVFNTPVGASSPGPAFPTDVYMFTVVAIPGEKLSFATMFIQSNDLFFAPADSGVELFSSTGVAISGDVTQMFMLWDGGTEVNQEPGIGMSQAPRQSGPNSGTSENGSVRVVNDGFTYPAVGSVIRVTITPTV